MTDSAYTSNFAVGNTIMARESYGLIVKLTNNRGLYARNSCSSRVWMAPDV